MQTKVYISIAVFSLIAVGGVGFYAGQKYAQSKATAKLVQDLEDFGNLFEIANGSSEQKQQSDGDYLTLKPSKQEKVEIKAAAPKTVKTELYVHCKRPGFPKFEHEERHMNFVLGTLYLHSAFENVIATKDCTCGGKVPPLDTAYANFIRLGGEKLTDIALSNSALQPFHNDYSDLIVKVIALCGRKF